MADARFIWKYTIPKDELDGFAIDLPRGARILHVDTQTATPCFWALVDPAAEKDTWRFRVFGTGHRIPHPEAWDYIGTFILFNGAFVGHLFAELIVEADG